MEKEFGIGTHIQGYGLGNTHEFTHGIVSHITDISYIINTGDEISKEFASEFDSVYWENVTWEQILLALSAAFKGVDYSKLPKESVKQAFILLFGQSHYNLVENSIRKSNNL